MATSYALDRLGRARLSSSWVRADLDSWLAVCALSASRLSGPNNDATTFMGPIAREGLEEAINALGRRHAAPLRAVVHRADERFLANTLPNTQDPPTPRWWWTRRPM